MPLPRRTAPRHPLRTRTCTEEEGSAVQDKRRDRLRPMAKATGCADLGN